MNDDKNELIENNDEKLIENKDASEEVLEPIEDGDEAFEDADEQNKAKRIKKEVHFFFYPFRFILLICIFKSFIAIFDWL